MKTSATNTKSNITLKLDRRLLREIRDTGKNALFDGSGAIFLPFRRPFNCVGQENKNGATVGCAIFNLTGRY